MKSDLLKKIKIIRYERKRKNIIKTLLENVISLSILIKEIKFSPVKNKPDNAKIKTARAIIICITFFLFSIPPSYEESK
ncbi:hypothetical protein V2H77_11995 [Photorhabdus sp. P32]|uniref:hypothetical protein n=1 Tax=Photorhabdus sp. P32 TaxID=3117549 RepID=UPI00311B3213